MKKRNIFLIALSFVFATLATSAKVVMAKAEEVETHSIQVHYHRSDAQYDKWDLWIWSKTPNGDGQEHLYANVDDYGGYTDPILLTNLTGTDEKSTQVGLIYRTKGSWSKQSGDIIVDVPATTEDGIFHAYLMDGSNEATLVAPQAGEIGSVNMTAINKLKAKIFLGNATIVQDNIRVLMDNTPLEITECSVNKATEEITVTLKENIDLTKALTFELTVEDRVYTASVGTAGLYDTEEFINAFTYDGDDLGAVISEDDSKTTFKLWAPTSTMVTLNLYEDGTPIAFGGDTDTPKASYEMTKEEKGVWSYEINDDLHGTYYTYTVSNSAGTNETIDPYAKACGVNGVRGLVVDFERINPEGWEYGKRANSIEKRTDANIYELHVRDYTKSETWGGPADKSGKYLGLSQQGTYYEKDGVKYATGLDHLKEMGITNIQILPFYDQATVDESVEEPSYNWGYDPLNYNCLEGSYSSNPFDGFVRIKEFKQMMMGLTEAGIRVNMDVVYNHTARSSTSNFHYVIPGYYHRLNSEGGFSNGSGCGNEIASERPMVQKFILDSTKFLYTEYNLSGYRFDLMALIDTDTMGKVYNQISEIDPLTLVYGEPWSGGTSTLPSNKATNKATVKYLVSKDEADNITGGVGYFNDTTRDSIVGRVPDPTKSGWVQNTAYEFRSKDYYQGIKFGITGGTDRSYLTSSPNDFVYDASQTLNYVACHDNNTLHDKLKNSTAKDSVRFEGEGFKAMNKQADSVVFFSQGIPFFQEGQEFLRSKPNEDGKGYDHNSYCSPDSVNMVRWDLKAEHIDVVNYYKDLISFRKQHEAFKLTAAKDIAKKLTFIEGMKQTDTTLTAIMYRLQDEKDIYSDMIIIHNVYKESNLKLPEGKWKIVFNDTGIVDGEIVQETVKVVANQTLVLANTSKMSGGNGGCASCGNASMGIVAILSAIALIGAVVIKRKENI